VVLLDRRPDEATTPDRCDLERIDNHRAGYLAPAPLAGAAPMGFLDTRQATTVRERN